MDIFFICCLFLSGLLGADAIMWYHEPNSQKCLREELQKDVLLTGEYEVSEAYGQKIDYKVKDSKGHILSQKEDISKGKFSFVTEDVDTFEICFNSRVPAHQRGQRQEVSLIIKRGVEAKSFERMGDASNLKPMEVELQILENLSEEIVKDFALMKKLEEEMRNTNESTNRRVFGFSLFGMICLLVLASWQVLYLRRYFRAKKLIG